MRKAYGGHRGSGITHFEAGPSHLTVHFGGKSYRYTAGTTGKLIVEEMKRLAANGQGLAAYIRQKRPQHEE